jgi:hypothetical protein
VAVRTLTVFPPIYIVFKMPSGHKIGKKKRLKMPKIAKNVKKTLKMPKNIPQN